MSNLLFSDDKRTDPKGFDEALHSLAAYMDDDEQVPDEDIRLMEILWDAHKCACGECENCWLFTPNRGAMSTLSFWVRGPKVVGYSMMGPSSSIAATHDLAAH